MAEETRNTLKDRFEKFIEDTATLDVVTFTGTITFNPATHVTAKADKKPGSFNFDTLFDDVVQQLKLAEKSQLQILAFTRAQWDMDSVNFVSKDASTADQKLIDAHQKAVESAQKSRFEAVKLVADFVGSVTLK